MFDVDFIAVGAMCSRDRREKMNELIKLCKEEECTIRQAEDWMSIKLSSYEMGLVLEALDE